MPWRVLTAILGDPRRLIRAFRGIPPFFRDAGRYRDLQNDAPASLRLRVRNLYPRLDDRFAQAGVIPTHYFHQDVWAAARIYEAAPAEHVDVGSRLDGFIGHLLAFREVTVLDIRPLNGLHPRLRFVRADLTGLPQPDRSIESLSCLHVVEHVGLGRYGDAVDPQGCFVAMRELQRVLASGGKLYFSVPIGRERLEFNAHRVFAPKTVLSVFDELELVEFSVVDDEGQFVERTDPGARADSRYACGLFVLTRL